MTELLIMALVFSVLTNIVQALNNEFSKGHRLGLKYASEFDEKLEALKDEVRLLAMNSYRKNEYKRAHFDPEDGLYVTASGIQRDVCCEDDCSGPCKS